MKELVNRDDEPWPKGRVVENCWFVPEWRPEPIPFEHLPIRGKMQYHHYVVTRGNWFKQEPFRYTDYEYGARVAREGLQKDLKDLSALLGIFYYNIQSRWMPILDDMTPRIHQDDRFHGERDVRNNPSYAGYERTLGAYAAASHILRGDHHLMPLEDWRELQRIYHAQCFTDSASPCYFYAPGVADDYPGLD